MPNTTFWRRCRFARRWTVRCSYYYPGMRHADLAAPGDEGADNARARPRGQPRVGRGRSH